jgi:hypothetical protein
LVDTGSDKTVFPTSVAVDLGITLSTGVGPGLTAFGGQNLAVEFGDVDVELSQDAETLRWSFRAQFVQSASPDDEMIPLGYDGFLEYFTATFDGKLAELTLVPSDDFPTLNTSAT